MDLADLKVFIAVADLKSMSKASEYTFLSQSSVSNKMSRLEKELNVKLFIRTSKGVALTPQGMKFYYYALYAASAIDTGTRELQAQEHPDKRSKLQIGMAEHIIPLVLPYFQELIQGGSGISCAVKSGSPLDIMLQFQTGFLDIAFVNDVLSPSDNSKKIMLFEDPLYLIGASSTKNIRKSIYYYADNSIFILLRKGTLQRELLDKELFERDRFFPKQIIEVDSTEVQMTLVGQGIGYSFAPLSLRGKTEQYGVHYLQCDELTLKQKLYCLYKDSTEYLLQGMLDGILDRVKHTSNVL
jgi:DNA-binding transcriptional LysR family regulator